MFIRNVLSRALHYRAPSRLKLALPAAWHVLVPAHPGKTDALASAVDAAVKQSSGLQALLDGLVADNAGAVGMLGCRSHDCIVVLMLCLFADDVWRKVDVDALAALGGVSGAQSAHLRGAVLVFALAAAAESAAAYVEAVQRYVTWRKNILS